ncbi:MAG: CoA-binding protein [Hyphomicrobium sp.]
MTIDGLSDDDIAAILEETKVIAVVGASANAARPVYGVTEFLIARGYAAHPVNPGLAGQTLHGRVVYAALADLPAPVDMVDIFRNSEAASPVVDDAITERARLGLKTIWMQLGVVNEAAAERARAAGLAVVMDRCPKIELARIQRG